MAPKNNNMENKLTQKKGKEQEVFDLLTYHLYYFARS